MTKNKAILIIPLIFLLMISIVYSQPPFIEEPVDITNGLVISFPLLFVFEQNKDIIFNFHVFNATSGVAMNSSNTNCTFHLFDNTGNHIINQKGVPFDGIGQDWELNVSGTNFTRLGNYAFLVNCQTSDLIAGGFDNHRFRVTIDGEDEESGEQDVKLRWLFYFAIILAILLFVIGLAKEDMSLIGFSGMLLMVIGAFMLMKGFAGLSNLMTNAVGIILVGLGFYIFFRANIEFLQEVF